MIFHVEDHDHPTRYGHRSDTTPEVQSGVDSYINVDPKEAVTEEDLAIANRANGSVYRFGDRIQAERDDFEAGDTWNFKLEIIDVCNNNDEGNSSSVFEKVYEIDWLGEN